MKEDLFRNDLYHTVNFEDKEHLVNQEDSYFDIIEKEKDHYCKKFLIISRNFVLI